MALWVDRHRPSNIDKLDFHKSQAARLKKLITSGDFPHLLFFGPPGSGKKTRIMCLLRELYGPGVAKRRIESKTFETPSNKKLEITTVASNYHIELTPSDAGIYDRVVVQEVIKGMAQTQQLDSSSQKAFKVVLLNQVDRLTRDAQHALRRTMEKYSSVCRLILACHSTSKIIPALRSRCLAVRVSAPSHDDVSIVLSNIAKKENVTLPDQLKDRIIGKAEGNLRRAILMLELCRVQQNHVQLGADLVPPDPDWEVAVRDIANMIVQEQSPKRLLEVREKYYELLIHCIPSDIIFKNLVKELVKPLDSSLKHEVCTLAATYEHSMQSGSKEIMHLEAFTAKFMAVYKKFIDEAMADM